MLLFHHRWPTSTINVRKAAHPFSTGDYFGDTQYILIHNGGVWNADDLFTDHQELGIEYKSLLTDLTFNDSEALLWDFALTMEGKQDRLKAYGGIAFVAIKQTKGVVDKLYFAKNSSKPLNLLRDKSGIMLSSEGEGEPIEDDTLYTYNYALKRLTRRYFKVRQYAETAGRRIVHYSGGSGGYTNTHSNDFLDNFGYRPYTGEYYLDENGHAVYEEEELYRTPSELGWNPHSNNTESVGAILQDWRQKQKPRFSGIEGATTEGEVFNVLCSYMKDAHGHYMTAYWAMEDDYQEFEGLPDSPDKAEILKVLGQAINLISDDGNFIDEYSVNPLWAPVEEADLTKLNPLIQQQLGKVA